MPEDRVLIGAPEYQFIGHAELGSTTHDWTPGEATQYPGNFGAGVIFSEAEVWDHPVPMQSVLPQLKLKETNPGAHFFSGVIRVTKDDYETVVAAGTGNPVELEDRPKLAQEHRTEPTPSPTPSPPGDGRRPVDVHLLFKTVEKLKTASAYGGSLSEYDTRAEFIDKYIDALGYTEFGDVQRGGSVDSGNFPDYVLRVNGKPAIAIEAKKLGTPLGAKEAGQVVGYCSSLGVRWEQ